MSSESKMGTVSRSTTLLRALAAGNYRGRALTELAAETSLPHPTVHRILARLVGEGLVVQNPQSRRYQLGPLLYELGLAAASSYDLGLIYRPVIERVAEVTGDTCYVIMRSGLEAVCVARGEGHHPIRTITLNIGSRRPLGVGAGGLAIVAACADDEARWIVQAIAPSIRSFGKLTAAGLNRMVQESRARGYATVTNQVQLGVTGVGLAFRDANGLPLGAISVGATNDRLPESRHGQVSRVLERAVADIEVGLRAMPIRS